MNRDPFLYPGTHVLINKFEIKDTKNLERLETGITNGRMGQPMKPPPTMTPEGYQAIHKHIFGDIYPWAGELRNINLKKIVTEKKNVEFLQGPLVAVNLKRVFHELKEDNFLKNLNKETFAFRAAVYLEDFNHIHPFREGNGRVQRLFLEQLANQAGYKLDQSRIDPKKWMEGSIQSVGQGVQGKHEIMTEINQDAIIGRIKERQKPKTRDRDDNYERDL